MTKSYRNDKRSKANKTKSQAEKNAQDVQSMWRRRKTKTSATNDATISSAAAASTSGSEEVEDVPAAQNKSQNSGPSPNSDVLLPPCKG